MLVAKISTSIIYNKSNSVGSKNNNMIANTALKGRTLIAQGATLGKQLKKEYTP